VRFLDETDGERAVDRAGVAREALGAYLLAVVAVTEDARGERALVEDLRNAPPTDLAYRIAGSLAVDAPQQQALLELETASARLEEETRILNRETELLRDLLVRGIDAHRLELRALLSARFNKTQVDGVMGDNWIDFLGRSLPD